MQTSFAHRLDASPPPLWYVWSGESVEGPMNTAMLLQGVSYGRVPTHSLVRAHAWTAWRELPRIREVRALQREKSRKGAHWHPPLGWLPPHPGDEAEHNTARTLCVATSQLETMLLALHAAVQETGAQVGLVHRFRSGDGVFATVFTHGPNLNRLEGEIVPGHDAAGAAALRGRGVVGSQGLGPSQRAVIGRLGTTSLPLHGVAMVPVRAGGRTIAMIELGRSDHPFRGCDKLRLAGVRRAVECRCEESGFGVEVPRHFAIREPRPLLLG